MPFALPAYHPLYAVVDFHCAPIQPDSASISGIMAAKPNEPPMRSLREWIAALNQAVENNDRATIGAVLKDAIPEFALNGK